MTIIKTKIWARFLFGISGCSSADFRKVTPYSCQSTIQNSQRDSLIKLEEGKSALVCLSPELTCETSRKPYPQTELYAQQGGIKDDLPSAKKSIFVTRLLLTLSLVLFLAIFFSNV